MGFHPSKARLLGQLPAVTLSASRGALQIPASWGQTCTPKHRDDQWSRISPHIVGDERTRGSSVEFDIWLIRPKAARSLNLVDRFVAHALAELQDFAGGRVLTA
jgi:hypothetical protein